jgi:hypothetical protein
MTMFREQDWLVADEARLLGDSCATEETPPRRDRGSRMSDTSRRFPLYFGLFAVSLVPFVLSLIGAIQLVLALATGVGVLTGSSISRRFMLAFVCMSGAGSLIGLFGGLLSLFEGGDPLMNALVCAYAAVSFALCLGMVSCLIDERFVRRMNSKRYARAAMS